MAIFILQVVSEAAGSVETYLIAAIAALASVVAVLYTSQQKTLTKVKEVHDQMIQNLQRDNAELKAELKEVRKENNDLIRELEPFMKSLNDTTNTLIVLLKSKNV